MDPRRLRPWAVVTAAILVAGELAAFAHLAFARHVTCPEHGELLDLGDAEGTTHASSNIPTAGETPASTDTHEHHGCALLPRGGERASIGGPAPRPAILDQTRPALFACERDRRSSLIALYRLAPKNSPPLA